MGTVGIGFDGSSARMIDQEHWNNPFDDTRSPLAQMAMRSASGKYNPKYLEILYVDPIEANALPGTFEIAYDTPIPTDAPKALMDYTLTNRGTVMEVFSRTGRVVYSDSIYQNPLLAPLRLGQKLLSQFFFDRGMLPSLSGRIPSNLFAEYTTETKQLLGELERIVVYPAYFDRDGNASPRPENDPDSFPQASPPKVRQATI